MKNHLFLVIILLVVGIGVFTFSFKTVSDAPGQIVTEQSNVTFSISHVGGRVTGTFTGMNGTVIFDENNLAASRMEVWVEAKTINTENRARDADLRKEKFFYVEKFPQLNFSSKEVTRNEDGFLVRGDLTIKDRTKEVQIPFTYQKQGAEMIFTGSFPVNRKDFDLGRSAFPPIGKVAKVDITAVVR